MYDTEINNGDKVVVASGSVVVQDSNQPLHIKVAYKSRLLAQVKFVFTAVKDENKAGFDKASIVDGDAIMVIRINIYPDTKNTYVVDTPFMFLGGEKSEKMFLSFSYESSIRGFLNFNYTFSYQGNKLNFGTGNYNV